MIKLSKPASIPYLSAKKVAHLLHLYKTKGNSVWLRKGITNELRKTSFNKCAYCEKKVNGNGSYMEVDHFQCKSKHDSLVVDWDNLIPSCKQCNTKKGKVDINAYPIINPFKDEPSDHLMYSSLRIKGTTDKGKNTVELLGFNLRDMDVRVNRLLILEKIDQSLEDALEAFCDYKDSNNVNQRKIIKARNIVRGLLSLCQSESEYCATNATLLLLNPNFYLIQQHLKSENLWDTKIEDYFVKATCLSFPVQKDEYTLVKTA
ncbi:HNH endonuclease [Providencia sp. PROV273]|uniref:HNH endonuclease n=1 Tax=Providencia sp. PROV273 TaxID=2949960 RepID=UPI0023494276|nr:HNH endonuclease [Providencia sp. PROV273]